MTDDIVTLLREDFCDFGQWENSCTPEGKCPCCLAADEIERLREKLAYYVRIHNEMYNRLDLWGLVAKFEAKQDFDD